MILRAQVDRLVARQTLLHHCHLFAALSTCTHRFLSFTFLLGLNRLTARRVLAMLLEFHLLLHLFDQKRVPLLAYHFFKVHDIVTWGGLPMEQSLWRHHRRIVIFILYSCHLIVVGHRRDWIVRAVESPASLKDISCLIQRVLLLHAEIAAACHLGRCLRVSWPNMACMTLHIVEIDAWW